MYARGFTDLSPPQETHTFQFPLIVLPSPSYNASFGGDPALGIVKQLRIQYRMNGSPGVASFPENATILLPTPQATTGG